MSITGGGHVPVLVAESLAGLALRDDGIYVDATFGRGGHSRAILAALGPRGRVIAIDRDPAAHAAAESIDDRRFVFRHARFSDAADVLDALHVATIDGALLDLGLSSPQLDNATRGFSYRNDGPLDMRMDPSDGESAAAFIARASTTELTEVIREYGEERFAQSIARAIAKAREIEPIVTTRRLAHVVAQAVGARTRGDWNQDPAARTFQAIRIAVNNELQQVSIALPSLTARLASGGRLVAISFHSLEDRIVKHTLRQLQAAGDIGLKVLTKRPIVPADEEVERNPRARSAKLRVWQRAAEVAP